MLHFQIIFLPGSIDGISTRYSVSTGSIHSRTLSAGLNSGIKTPASSDGFGNFGKVMNGAIASSIDSRDIAYQRATMAKRFVASAAGADNEIKSSVPLRVPLKNVTNPRGKLEPIKFDSEN